jgi:pimeloyl-ACP methyl ester carboxylesterase
MTAASQAWTEELVELAGSKIQLVKGGSGEPLLILHDEMGHPGWLRWHQELARDHTLYIPSHSGYGGTPLVEWILGMRDLAGWYLEVLDDLGLGPVKVIGNSLGGWLAAEMAAMSPSHFEKMVLVGPTGIRPPVGEIYDMFLVVSKEFLTANYHDPAGVAEFQQICPDEPSPEQAEAWEIARESSSRLAWRPYMYDPSLPHLLHRVRNLPTQIVWGKEDQIVPLSAGEAYQKAIAGSRLTVLENSGHHPEIERTEEFVALVRNFLA